MLERKLTRIAKTKEQLRAALGCPLDLNIVTRMRRESAIRTCLKTRKLKKSHPGVRWEQEWLPCKRCKIGEELKDLGLEAVVELPWRFEILSPEQFEKLKDRYEKELHRFKPSVRYGHHNSTQRGREIIES